MRNVLLQKDREISEAYKVSGTPIALLINPDGTIGSELAPGAEPIKALIARSVGVPSVPAPLPTPTLNGNGNGNGTAARTATQVVTLGEVAPGFTLPDLSGKPVSLADFKGSKTLLLFWNPGCGFCQQMLADLKAWENKPPKSAPKLLVVSTGSVADNKALGLKSTVVLDQSFSVAPSFGANGTPMAVMVDGSGRLASSLAIGANAVMTLAGEVPSATGAGVDI